MKIINKQRNDILINDEDIHFLYTKSSGPGGQKINKVSTGVQIVFDVKNSKYLSEKIKSRIFFIANSRINKEGKLIIKANRFRSQFKNKQDAIRRLTEIILIASRIEKRRIGTNPTSISQDRRIKKKKINSMKKSLRKKYIPNND